MEIGEMVASTNNRWGRKVRTPQDKAPLKRRVSVITENGKCNRKQTALFSLANGAMVKWWCKRPPVPMGTWVAR